MKIPTKQEILEIRMHRENGTYSMRELSEKFGMSKSAAHDIATGKSYSHILMPSQRKEIELEDFYIRGVKKFGLKKHLCKKLPESDIWWVKECNPGFFYSHHADCLNPDVEKLELCEKIMNAGYPCGAIHYDTKEGTLYVEVLDIKKEMSDTTYNGDIHTV